MATRTQLTAEQFFDLPDSDTHRELVFGEVVEVSPPGMVHGLIAARMAFELQAHLKKTGGGFVLVGAGFVLPLPEDRDRVRIPDVAFVADARMVAATSLKGFRGAPDLAVEVLSPSDGVGDVTPKVRDYLDAGARLIWVISAQARVATVYRADGSARLVREKDFLEGEDLLPGLRISLGDLLPDR